MKEDRKQKKLVTIIVNGRPFEVKKEKISFEEIVH